MALEFFRFKQNNFGEKILEEISHLFNFLSKSDHRDFSTYLKSPFFDVDQQSIELYDYLLPFYKRGTRSTNAEIILNRWNKKHEEAKYGINHLLKKTKHLYQHTLGFLAHQKLRDNKKARLQLLQKRLRNQGVSIPFRDTTQGLHQILSSAPSSIDKLFDELQLSYLSYYSFSTDHEQKGLKLILSLKNQLESFYQTTKTVFECELQNLKRTSCCLPNIKHQPFPEYVASDHIQQLFELCMAVYDDFGCFSDENFKLFSETLLGVHQDLDPMIRFILCKYAVNALSNLVNKGQDGYKYDLLRWLKRRVEWMPQSFPQVNDNEFLNLIIVSCHCGNISDARLFSKTHAHLLPAKHFEDAVQLGEAYCCFFEKKYKPTRMLLKAFSSSHYKYTLRSKTLLIRACLADELAGNDGYDEFLRIKEELRKYIDRLDGKISKSYHEAYKKFFLLCNEIFLLQKSKPNQTRLNSKKSIEKLKAKIINTNHLIAKKWLLSIVENTFY